MKDARVERCCDPNCPICYPQPPAKEPVRFDEQLRLIGPDHQPAYDLYYMVTLADGSHHSGFTDRAGMTKRIASKRALAIESIMLQPPSAAWGRECCGGEMNNEKIVLKLDKENLATNDMDVGTSVATIRLPEGKKRRLTEGEIAMARTVFGDGVDYGKVWVHHRGWWLFGKFQDKNTAVTPNGHMYYPHAIYRDDFSASDDPDGQALFMHEMVHVWQKQMGYSVKFHGLTVTMRGPSAYVYNLTPQSRLRDFNMEQQGNIMSDYYMICVLQNEIKAFNPGKDPELLRKVMAPFLADPRDRDHLPRN